MDKIEEARTILTELGYAGSPKSKLPPLVLLALGGVRKSTAWSKASRQKLGVSKGITVFIRGEYQHDVAENTRESIRKTILKPLISLGVIEQNPGQPGIPTNSSLNFYALTEAALEVIRRYGSAGWDAQLQQFRTGQVLSGQRSAIRRRRAGVVITLRSGKVIGLSPGPHNELAAGVVEEMAACFFPHAEVVYLGDQAQKDLFSDPSLLQKLKLAFTVSEPLPDVVMYDASSDCVIFVEAVTSGGPISDYRRTQLEELSRNCRSGKLFVTAFPDFKAFSQHAKHLAWNTEVWIAERPEHLIHFNGQVYLKPTS